MGICNKSALCGLVFAGVIAFPGWSQAQQQNGQQPSNTTQQQYFPPQNFSQDQQPAPQPQNSATVGTINYVEGKAAIDGRSLGANANGNAALEAGQTLTTTQTGKVEILLTPGVFFRAGGNSAVRMVSPSLADTEIALDRGEATVEVGEIQKANNIVVDMPGGKTQVLKKGFYEFDATQGAVRVFKGEARLTSTAKTVTIKGDHQVALNDPQLKSHDFDEKQYDTSSLYRWSSLRSSYLAEANVNAAAQYANGEAFVPGWGWDPWFDAWTWIPGDGIFWSPFGWGFYSPFFVAESPFFYYGYFGGHYMRHFGPDFHGWGPGPHYGPHSVWHGSGGAFAGGHAYHGFGGGYHGGGFAGGGFHGGGGGGRGPR